MILAQLQTERPFALWDLIWLFTRTEIYLATQP